MNAIPKWCRIFLTSVGFGGAIFSIIPSALLFVLLVLAVPVIIGESRGREAAVDEYSVYQIGCDNKTSRDVCVDILKDGKQIARGFVIDSSPSHVALYDVALKRARVLERAETELIADPPKIQSHEKNGKNRQPLSVK